jgi:hypothetical protein
MASWLGGSTQTTTQSSEPWKPSQGLLKLGLKDAKKLYEDGVGGDVYTGSTVIPWSNQTMQGMNGLESLANRNSGGNGLSGSLQDILNNGGFNSQQLDAMRGLTSAGQRNDALYRSLGSNGLTGIQDKALSGLQGNMNSLNSYMRSLGSNGLSSAQDAAMGGFRGGISDLNALTKQLGANGLTKDQDAVMRNLQGTRNSVNSLTRQLGSNGLTNTQDKALQGLQSGRNNISSLLKQLGSNGLSSDQDIALKNYRNTATSNFDYSPDFQSVLDASLSDARNGVNANAAAAGRYGSGVAQGVMADRLGRVSNDARLGEYRDWQNRKDAATGNLANLAQTGLGNRTNALQLGQSFDTTMAGLGQQGLQNRQSNVQLTHGINNSISALGQQGIGNNQNNIQLGQGLNTSMANLGQTGVGNLFTGNQQQQALNSQIGGLGQQGLTNQMGLVQNGQGINSALFNAGQAGLGNMQNAYSLAQAPYQTQMQVGGMYEDLASRLKNDELRIFNDTQNKDWNQIARLNAIASGAGQLGGTQISSQPGQNPFLSALGLGLSGFGLIS